MADTCPRCGHRPVDADRCPRCGVVVPAFVAALAALRRGPPRPPAAAAAPAAPPFRVPAPQPSPAPAAPAPRRLVFHGSGGTLFGLQVVNALLTLATLGVYYFWARTRVRAYLLGQTALEGDRLAYHGTGGELLRGFLRGVAVFFVPVGLFTILPEVWGAPEEVRAALGMLGSALVLLLVPIAMVGARRYRLSRTSWRGIRFSFRGRVRDFVGLFVVGGILTALTLGLYYPLFITQRQAFMVSNTWFGSVKFDFDGRGRDLLRPFLLAVLLFVPTLGLSWFWFVAGRHRYFADHTRFGGARFRSTVTGGAQARLTLGNTVALVATLGLAWPWTLVRWLHFTFRYLTLEGPLELETVEQDARGARATGEALAGILDADLGFG